jgi:hypothetical protein
MINSFVIDSYNNETRQETINSLPEITISSAKYKAFSLAKYFYAPSILFERRFRMCATNI